MGKDGRTEMRHFLGRERRSLTLFCGVTGERTEWAKLPHPKLNLEHKGKFLI